MFLKALGCFGGFRSLWQVWKALGSFDVNMVCPLPGSWINHVIGFSDKEVTKLLLHVFLQGLLKTVYGNVVFFVQHD